MVEFPIPYVVKFPNHMVEFPMPNVVKFPNHVLEDLMPMWGNSQTMS